MLLLVVVVMGAVTVPLWSVTARGRPLLVAAAMVILVVLAVGHVVRVDLTVGESRLSPTLQRLLALPLLVGVVVLVIWAEGPSRFVRPTVALAVMPGLFPVVMPRRLRQSVLWAYAGDTDKDHQPTGPTTHGWSRR